MCILWSLPDHQPFADGQEGQVSRLATGGTVGYIRATGFVIASIIFPHAIERSIGCTFAVSTSRLFGGGAFA